MTETFYYSFVSVNASMTLPNKRFSSLTSSLDKDEAVATFSDAVLNSGLIVSLLSVK